MKNFKLQKNEIKYRPALSIANGFSLIELMVSTGIFALVMVVALGSLMTASNGAKKARALRVAMDNVNFVMDNITRDLRVGVNYTENTPNSQISFTPYNTTPPKVYFQLFKIPGGNSQIERCEIDLTVRSNCSALTAPEVDITKLEFTISPTMTNEIQPSVYIQIEGEISANGVKEKFDLHSLASQRNAK